MLLCCDIGGSYIKQALSEAQGVVSPLPTMPTPLADYNGFISLMRSVVQNLPVKVEAVALSITGLHEPRSGLLTCANIPGIHHRPLQNDLSMAIGLPVMIFNDATCFALAEAVLGAGSGHANVFTIILGSGVGGAQVLNSRVVEGADSIAGEWGHGTILATEIGEPPQRLAHFKCGCGRMGCVNTVGGARGLEALHLRLSGHTATSFDILRAWKAQEAAALRTLAIYFELVSAPLAFAMNITGASIIIAGGGLATDADFLKALDVSVRSRILRPAPHPLLHPAALGEGAGLMGASLAGFQELSHAKSGL